MTDKTSVTGNARTGKASARRLGLAIAFAGVLAGVPAQADDRARVVFESPEAFSDLAASPGEGGRTDPALLQTMKTQFETAIQRHLRPGQRLSLAIRDVDLAGRMMLVGLLDGQWQPNPVQVRKITADAPPRIELRYALIENDQVVDHDLVTLVDPDFLAGVEDAEAAEPLLFERRLFERWLVQLLGTP